MPEARYFAAAVPLLQGVRLAAIGAGWITSASSVRAVSREGGRQELLRGRFHLPDILNPKP
jgi:phytol kinase